MRVARQQLRLGLSALALIMVVSSLARAQSNRIAFSSDRGAGDYDVWLSKDEGSRQTLFSDEPMNAPLRRPSICDDGQWIFYDNFTAPAPGYSSELWVKKNSHGEDAQLVFDCANFTGAPFCYPDDPSGNGVIGSCASPMDPLPTLTGGPCSCREVACGPTASFGQGPRILFTYGAPHGTRENIVIANWDVSTGTMKDPCKLTSTGGGPPNPSQNNSEPEWCGSNHVVFTRGNATDEQGNYILGLSICTMEATTSEVPEVRCHITDDGLWERHPSCGLRDGRWTVAYARQKPGAPSSVHQICTVDLDQTTFDFDPQTVACTPADDLAISWTRPTWAPSGSQIAFAANMDRDGNPTVSYNIYKINVTEIGKEDPAVFPHTQNVDENDDPDWGPATLNR